MPPAGLLRVKVSVGVAFKSSTNLIYLILIGKGRFLGGELLPDIMWWLLKKLWSEEIKSLL